MNISPDLMFDRLKLKQNLNKWKIVSVLLFILLLIALKLDYSKTKINKDYIARVIIDGIITEDTSRTNKIYEIANNKNIKAVIFKINSPGGTSYGGEELFNAINYVSKNKTSVCVLGSVAASGGYMAAVGCDYIIAGSTSITGSIGVVMQSFNVKELLNKLGIVAQSFKSSELKASPSPFEDLTENSKQAIEDNIKEVFNYFVKLVQQRRKLTNIELHKVSNGKVFIGEEALKLKLIDAIGYERDAVKWIQEKDKISSNIEVKDYQLYDHENILKNYLVSAIDNKIFSKFMNEYLMTPLSLLYFD